MDGIGDFSQTSRVLEKAWEISDASAEKETHWRDIMKEFGFTLLFN
jgi:hypothetical protein